MTVLRGSIYAALTGFLGQNFSHIPAMPASGYRPWSCLHPALDEMVFSLALQRSHFTREHGWSQHSFPISWLKFSDEMIHCINYKTSYTRSIWALQSSACYTEGIASKTRWMAGSVSPDPTTLNSTQNWTIHQESSGWAGQHIQMLWLSGHVGWVCVVCDCKLGDLVGGSVLLGAAISSPIPWHTYLHWDQKSNLCLHLIAFVLEIWYCQQSRWACLLWPGRPVYI